jgi:hypothetical protein
MEWLTHLHTHTQTQEHTNTNRHRIFCLLNTTKGTELVTFESPGKFNAEQNIGQLGFGVSIEGTVTPPLPVQIVQTHSVGCTKQHQSAISFGITGSDQCFAKTVANGNAFMAKSKA